MAELIENYIKNYKDFVTKNPLLANEIEVSLKWLSYFVAGRFSQSPVVTECIHSASKLLMLVNDNILRKAAGIPVHLNVVVEKLQTFLTVIEYSEVFAEVAARQTSGSRGKWFIVVATQIVKFAIRLLLLLQYDEGLQASPPIPPLNRRKELTHHEEECLAAPPQVSATFTLKTSGRVMRSLHAAPPLVSRSWKLPEDDGSKPTLCTPSRLHGKVLTAEVLHLARPLIHLASMGIFGEFSWKPWMIALGIDATSLRLLKEKSDLSKVEKMEVSRRTLSMIFYLIRSPFYDQYSRERIIHTLQAISQKIPGSGLLLKPLIDYIPEWQQMYSYTWS